MRIHIPRKKCTNWQQWFAWHPVYVPPHIIWLEQVWWCRDYESFRCIIHYHHNYRVKNQAGIEVNSPYDNAEI